jgi:hypothetical protein
MQGLFVRISRMDNVARGAIVLRDCRCFRRRMMPMQVVNGAQLACSFGAAPASLTVLPANRRITDNQPAANIMDYVPMVNIMPFGMCMSPSNPQVAAATAAALGVLTPQPCIPATSSPWTPGSPTVILANQPALNDTSTCMCMWAGVITITYAGQSNAQIA